ncbi:hypothetical protein GJV26_05110 [Massilia dura]|uniref:Uncharacterized protein n=1 Tax=Pseudoduganella dura TaxID=321982 RepID=A0A6I3X837_9BURK|nr:hypothetical protein [Pseudoduganella dura]MUI11866.1 hypothetical protein [Pseudoduganella dura]GGY08901.1 hypothetical protein GCM10007386_44220 [Pseudoduganella dura]
MSRMLWVCLVAAGLLLARLAYAELDVAEATVAGPGTADLHVIGLHAGALATANGTLPEIVILVLLTAGLLAGLFGVAGLLGMLGWIPLPRAQRQCMPAAHAATGAINEKM